MEKREEVKEFLLSKCKILNTYSWSDDRKAYDVPKYVLSDSKTLKLIDQIFNEHEAQLKAKDEEIERLKADKECANDVIKKLHHTKARSIVSMLFWEWRKHHRMYYESSKARNPSALTHLNSATLSKLMFKQAYKMSKDIK